MASQAFLLLVKADCSFLKYVEKLFETPYLLKLFDIGSPFELSESVGVSNFIVIILETLTLFLKMHL